MREKDFDYLDRRYTDDGNTVQFKVTGEYALFSDPITRVGGEKCTYPVPTYEALKGILKTVYCKPTFIWVIDKVRIMKRIQTEASGTRLLKYNGGTDLAYYTYLKDVEYQVQAHISWNQNRPEFYKDRNMVKHKAIAERYIKHGSKRTPFMGVSSFIAYVEPCVFGEGEGYYDDLDRLDFGTMYHGFTYPDESYSPETRGRLTTNIWHPIMEKGVIEFIAPEDCIHKFGPKMNMGHFEPREDVEETSEGV